MERSGNTVLITGGSAGIGLEVAGLLVARGNEVIVCGRDGGRLEEARKRIPELNIRVSDLAVPSQRQALVNWVTSSFPALNVLVNNAGVQHLFDIRAGVRDLPSADEEIAINLNAPIHLTAMLVEHLMQRPHAAIVNVSSGLAFAPLTRVAVYCATKAALHSFTVSLRHQLKSTNVRVFEIIPPIVATGLGKDHRPPGANATAMTVEACAHGFVEALDNDTFEAPLGEAVRLRQNPDGLFARMNPD